jgi:hypothetical protein
VVTYATIQKHIDRGRGIAAKKLGPPFQAYRFAGATNGDFPSGWARLTVNNQQTFPLFRRRLGPEDKVEIALKGVTIWYKIIADMTPFLLGDVFVQADPPYVPGQFYGAGATALAGAEELNAIGLAWHPAVNVAVGARLDRLVTIFRPSNVPATMPDGRGYWKSTADNDLPLVLTNGQYRFGIAGAKNASLIPAGLAAHTKHGASLFDPKVPGVSKIQPGHWYFYLPPLPGYLPREGDAIVTQDGARYVVTTPFEQRAGVVGNQLIADRKVAQVA